MLKLYKIISLIKEIMNRIELENKLNLTLLNLNKLKTSIIYLPDLIIELKKLHQYQVSVERFIIMKETKNQDKQLIEDYKISLEIVKKKIEDIYQNISSILEDSYNLT